jgi:hypothetical protein
LFDFGSIEGGRQFILDLSWRTAIGGSFASEFFQQKRGGGSLGESAGILTRDRYSEKIEGIKMPLIGFKKLVKDTLAYSDCAKFMADVIAKAGELSGGKNDPVSNDIMTLYAMVNRQARGGFRLNHNGPAFGYTNGYQLLEEVAGGGGATWGLWGQENITIWINEQEIPVNTTATNRARVPFIYAHRAFHELFHAAGSNGYYGHDIMNASARALDPNVADFDAAFRKHCIPSDMW